MSNYLLEKIGKSFKAEEIAEIVKDSLFLIKVNLGDPQEMMKTFIQAHNKKMIFNHTTITKALVFYETNYNIRTNAHTGHWAGLALRGKEAYFFDSLGIFPDDELDRINKQKMSNTPSVRYLGLMLYDLSKAGFNIHYNPIKFQEDKAGINTCGRFVCMFLEEAIYHKDPYKYMKDKLDGFKNNTEKYYDEAIVRYKERE